MRICNRLIRGLLWLSCQPPLLFWCLVLLRELTYWSRFKANSRISYNLYSFRRIAEGWLSFILLVTGKASLATCPKWTTPLYDWDSYSVLTRGTHWVISWGEGGRLMMLPRCEVVQGLHARTLVMWKRKMVVVKDKQRLNTRPALPTNGLPVKSSVSPGASPINRRSG